MHPVVVGLNAVVVAVTDEVPYVLTLFAQDPSERGSESLPTDGSCCPPQGPSERGSESLPTDGPICPPQGSSERGSESFPTDGPSGRAGDPLERAIWPPQGESIPFGWLDPSHDRTLELALRRCLRERTGIDLGYVEQLYTFGDRNRDPSESGGGPRVVSVAYLALGRQKQPLRPRAEWREWYAFFPWEDWRDGRPEVIDRRIEPALKRWIRGLGESDRAERVERIDIAFGLAGAPWDPERVLERYELLYEAGMIEEARRDRPSPPGVSDGEAHVSSSPLALDHRRILSAALGRLRGKLKYRPVVFELVPPAFTLFQLQRVVEALAGVRLHKQNFRRLVEKGGLVERTGQFQSETGGRPAELFRFRRDVLRERPAPGVGLPGMRI